VAEPGGDDMYGDTCQQQGRGVDMAQIVQPGMGKWIIRLLAALRLVVSVDEDGDER